VNKKLSHVDESGSVKMVDVSSKTPSERIAIAKGQIVMAKETLNLIVANNIAKGDVLTVSKVAGIMGAKRTAELIPLCHPLQLSSIDVILESNDSLPGININAVVKNVGSTGVEMEALTAVAVAALTIYDMVKAVDKTMTIGNIRLVEKRGGKSGDIHND
jgi:molybdenum cofactor biosynthesis protein MoaC